MKANIFWIAISIVFLLGVAIFFGLRMFSQEMPAVNIPVTANYNGTSVGASNNASVEPAARVVTGEESSEPSVTYRTGEFDPQKLTLKANNSGGGCFVRVVNASANPLAIELGPYSAGDYRGPQYAAIPPGGNVLIDPRYRIPKIVFYNRDKPAEDFLVELEKGCKLE